MRIWTHASQRFKVPVRYIATATSPGTTTVQELKPRPKLETEEQQSSLRKPLFDVVEHLKTNPGADILGLNRSAHRLAPTEVVEAALTQAHTAGEVVSKDTTKEFIPQRTNELRENAAPGVAQNSTRRGPPRENVNGPYDTRDYHHSTSSARNRPSLRRDVRHDEKDMKKVRGRREGQSWMSEGWGEDKLRPPAGQSFSTKKGSRRVEPDPSDDLIPYIQGKKGKSIHSSRRPPSYERRIEGLIDASVNVLKDVQPKSRHLPIAQLAHGLDRVLFNPGVHWLQDPRSRVYNFSPYLETIPKVNDFAFERLSGFIKSSRDEDLWHLAKSENRTFAGSTSSLSGILSQIYFLISEHKNVNSSLLSSSFRRAPKTFTPGLRMPASVIFNYNDGVYTIDSAGDSALSDKNILTWLGTMLENFLTKSPEEFSTYMRSWKPPSTEESQPEPPMRDAYRYAKSERFVMRSQLDCQDKRLPGTGVFDIKTRACLPIRMDLLNFEENSGYLIKKQYGTMESFEKEYFDLVRSAFLKYSFQARIGNMDGVIVAYHNTARLFGFQYIPLEEMEMRLYGPRPGVGKHVFRKCVGLMEQVAEEVVQCFPQQTVRCTFETQDQSKVMNVWVEPAEWTSSEPRPIKQLQVRANNFMNNTPVRGFSAVAFGDRNWTTHWSIARLSDDNHDPRPGLIAAQDRQFRAYNIPTGVDPADLAEFWHGLDFGGKAKLAQLTGKAKEGEEPHGAPYDASYFRQPNRGVRVLREFARAGREETNRLRREERGKPVWVLGETEPLPRDVIDAALEMYAGDMSVAGVVAEDGEQGQDLKSPDVEGEVVNGSLSILEGATTTPDVEKGSSTFDSELQSRENH